MNWHRVSVPEVLQGVDWDALSDREETKMADVVLVRDLATYFDRDRSSFSKLLKRNGIQTVEVLDVKTDQKVKAITKEDAIRVAKLLEPEHVVLDPSEVLE